VNGPENIFRPLVVVVDDDDDFVVVDTAGLYFW
jgi:hypothetical protein